MSDVEEGIAPVSVWRAFEISGSFESLASGCPHCGFPTRWERQNVVVVAGALVPAVSRQPVILGTLEIALCALCRGMAIGLSGATALLQGRPDHDTGRINVLLYPSEASAPTPQAN